MSKEYYYYTIPEDRSSTKITITREQLYEIEKKLSAEAAYYRQNDVTTAKAQRDIATLMSVSWHCLGGNDPYKPSKNRKRVEGCPNVFFSEEYREDYKSYFFIEALKILDKFDRSRGSWTQAVRWARGKAIRSTIAAKKKTMQQKELLTMLENAVKTYGTCFLMDTDSAETEEIYSLEAKNEEYYEDTKAMDGGVGDE